MRTSRRWLTVIAAAGGLLIAGSPAIPAQAATSYHICLENASSYCLQFVTAGNQETITNNSANYANFHVVRTSGRLTQVENGSGNCLRAGDNHVVKMENGGCVATNNADWWFDPGDAPNRIESNAYSDFMLVHGTVNGFNVWHADPVSGDWSNWVSVTT